MDEQLRGFLLRAKRATYASGIAPQFSSRPGSHDLHYEEPSFLYIDSYQGGFYFIGEEVVWKDGINVWGMNYYGKMLVDPIPPGFSGFLKEALLNVPAERPYRGPERFTTEKFTYLCSVEGEPDHYSGVEEIRFQEKKIYVLDFHGGEIKD
jgi:hypothetical protein